MRVKATPEETIEMLKEVKALEALFLCFKGCEVCSHPPLMKTYATQHYQYIGGGKPASEMISICDGCADWTNQLLATIREQENDKQRS